VASGISGVITGRVLARPIAAAGDNASESRPRPEAQELAER
jgi:hypothetical protein